MTGLPAIEKTIVVPATPARAFDVFTSEIGAWWPVASHSVSSFSGDRPRDVVFEAKAGGRIYEVLSDGKESLWGTVSECVPGRRIVFSWHPGRSPTQATTITVVFEPEGGDATTVTLIHVGWENLAEGVTIRPQYETGWDLVFCEAYQAAVQS